ncbi:MAG: FAD-dependent oxidoreductase [Pirellulales bacterium]|nr:FAD-dependent oxidoreductase [Pirellulales bacterium]
MNTSRRSFLLSSTLGVAGAAGLGRAMAEDAPPADKATFRLTRDIPVEEGYDVIVAGGGPGGVSAAIAAARLGAKVLLVEATGCLGGMGTSGLVSQWSHLGNGKEMLVGGLILEMVKRLCRGGQVEPGARGAFDKDENRYLGGVGFNPEALKVLLDELCREAGVEVRFFTRAIDADVDPADRRVRGVVTNNVEGYRYLRGTTFIDGTGDAVLADLCGAKCRAAGRDTPDIMPPTLCAMICDIDRARFNPGHQQAAVDRAIADGFFTQPDRHVSGLFYSTDNTATMNAGHMFHTDALNNRSLSDAAALGRRLVQEYVRFFKKYVPGCEKIQAVGTGSLVGVRESRRIVGEYELNFDDFQARRHFPDQIAVFASAVDVHVHDTSPEEYKRFREEFTKLGRLKPGESYGIPYGVLVPRGWANLWVAGRAVSTDVRMHGAIRLQASCSMMGQAAGTAAVQSLRAGQRANDLDTEALVLALRKAGAKLPQAALSKTMTRRA